MKNLFKNKKSFSLYMIVNIIISFFIICVFSILMRDAQVPSEFKNKKDRSSFFENKYLTHRMIYSDLKNGIVDEKLATLAYGAVNNFFNDVISICDPSKNIENNLTCANKILGQHFYYKAANTAAKAYANHYSDCDLNAYLLLDALKLLHKKIDIVFAPRHAFLSFVREEDGGRFYWETTKNSNSGELADLAQPLYVKTIHRFYYTPYNENYMADFYPVLSLSDIKEDKWNDAFNSISNIMYDNPFYLDHFYLQKLKKNDIDDSDIQSLYNIIQTDISAIEKRIILASIALKRNNNTLAGDVINQIDINLCNTSCVEVKSKISKLYLLDYLIMKIFNKFDIKTNENSIQDLLFYLAVQWIISLLWRFKKNILIYKTILIKADGYLKGNPPCNT
ncbi:hypothetical protein [Pectobacterium sp. LFLA-215]|uniref:hypothetical protein n=1 Tax=Pectobacterium sp. LFLA-215 TaxID=3419008 RepID=UPI003F5C5A27